MNLALTRTGDAVLMRLGLIDDAAIELADAALACAAADRPADDLSLLRARLTGLATRLLADSSGMTTARSFSRLLAETLAGREGLTGDTQDYDNPANADLAKLFERRRGLPITLSLLYVALARRVGWQADVLNVPGHVLVSVGGETDRQLIDPFDHGRPIDRSALSDLIAQTIGGHITPSAEHLRPLSNREILVRLLSNQTVRARRGGDTARALLLTERMTLFAPRFTGLWWERARLEQLVGDVAAARASLAAMLETTHEARVKTRIASALAALAV